MLDPRWTDYELDAIKRGDAETVSCGSRNRHIRGPIHVHRATPADLAMWEEAGGTPVEHQQS